MKTAIRRPADGVASELPLVLGCVALTLWTYRLALGSYFSPDDLILLERAQGWAPNPPTLWRFLSGKAYFQFVVPWFGLAPLPYLVVNWLLHATNTALLYVFARRASASVPAAALASGLFGTSRLFFTAVSQAVGIGDLLALTFTLAAAIALTARTRGVGWLATPAFAAALLAKESALLLPLALLLVPAAESLATGARRVAPLLAVAAGWAAYLAVTNVRGVAFGGPAYETAFGTNLFHSLMSFAEWSVDLANPTPDFISESPTTAWKTGAWVVLGLVALVALARGRTRLPAIGAAWWFLGLLPVLPLLWQRHLHYLYLPSAGLALAIGGAMDLSRNPTRARSGRTPRQWSAFAPTILRWAVVAFIVLGHAAISEARIRDRIRSQIPGLDLPLDPFVRKVELIRRVSSRIGAAVGERHARVVILVPDVGAESVFYGHLMESVIHKKRGLRVLHPNLDSVAFVKRWTPDYAGFELFAGSVDGRIVHVGTGADAHLRLVELVERAGFPNVAREHLAAAASAYPQDPAIQYALRARINGTTR